MNEGDSTARLGIHTPAGTSTSGASPCNRSEELADPQAMPLTDIRIVLVDDEAGVLKALTMVLQAFGARVKEFPRADLALNALCASHSSDDPVTVSPDIIVSDLRMPGISGVEFFTALRSFGNTTPFLLMSGHAAGDEISEALTLGVSGFVAKPFAPPQLISEIIRFASARSVRSNTP